MRPRTRKTGLFAVVTLAILLATVLHAAAPARTVKIAVLTPGLSFGEVLAGFRDGLSQLGYREHVNLTLVVDGDQVTPAMRQLHAEFFPDCAA